MPILVQKGQLTSMSVGASEHKLHIYLSVEQAKIEREQKVMLGDYEGHQHARNSTIGDDMTISGEHCPGIHAH